MFLAGVWLLFLAFNTFLHSSGFFQWSSIPENVQNFILSKRDWETQIVSAFGHAIFWCLFIELGTPIVNHLCFRKKHGKKNFFKMLRKKMKKLNLYQGETHLEAQFVTHFCN